jgi:amidophosphoribosyltransferase
MTENYQEYKTEKVGLGEKCGIIAIYNPTKFTPDLLNDGITATRAVFHRGQEGLGGTVNTEFGPVRFSRKGTFEEVYTPDLREEINKINESSNWALFHCRYGTSGDYKDYNMQPITVKSKDRKYNFSVIHNGEFVANEEMKKYVHEELPEEASDTYIFAKMLEYSSGETADQRILSALEKVNGAYSLIIGTNDAIYIARDQFGIRPMVMGGYKNGWIIASETCALEKLRIPIERQIKRGEVIRMNEDGLKILKDGEEGEGNFCDFEWAYFSRPDSRVPIFQKPDDYRHPNDWLSFSKFREDTGYALAREKPIKNADFVVGLPDSGIPLGLGYAAGLSENYGLKIPYKQYIVRDRYNSSRIFMDDKNMNKIQENTLKKLSTIKQGSLWKGKIVVITDDSIVRGNTTKQVVKEVFDLGAKEVHVVPGFPRVMHPCFLGVSMRTHDELIANQNNGNEKAIAMAIGATSVNYISDEGFIRARLGSKDLVIPKDRREIYLANGGCGGCVTGLYPIDKEGVIFKNKNPIPAFY